MLPNWLYGKSKSKLASILGGGGGTPPDYNQVKAQVNQNTEDILLLNDTLDDKAALTQINNRNLLDNPWFTVNQRGFSSKNDNGFTVDRWAILQAAGTVSLVNGAINIDPNVSGTTFLWGEIVENALAKLSGRVCTLSVMLSDGTIKATTFTFPTNIPSNSQIVSLDLGSTHRFEVYGYTSGHARVGYYNNNGEIPSSPLTIKAVKLEVGEVSTLAMDTAPDMALELAKCQRYFYKTLQFDDNGANISPNQCLAVSTTRLQGIKFPVEMRANPVITINKVNELGSSTAITGVTSQWTSKEGISYFTIADATVGNLYIVDFEASAEL